MKVEINDFIGIFDNAVTDEYCDSLVDFFERLQHIGKEDEKDSPIFKENSSYKKRTRYMFIGETDPLIIDKQSFILPPFVKAIQNCYQRYIEEYRATGFTKIGKFNRHTLNPDIKLQKTLPGEGYHIWHCEVMNISSSRRFLFCMLYLNDVDEGGETEFIYQQKRIKPVKGRVVICPTAFTHTHRGNPPLNNAKYMINGWMEFWLDDFITF